MCINLTEIKNDVFLCIEIKRNMKNLILIMCLALFCQNVQAQKSLGGASETGVMRAKNSKKYEFKVTYLNGETRMVTSSIDINFCARTMMLNDENVEIEEEGAIFPPETENIERIFKDGTTMKGYPRDSIWVFPVYEGKVNALATLPHKKIKFVEFLEKDDVLMNITENSMYNVFSDSPEATALLEKSLNNKRWAKRMGFWVAPVIVAGLFTGEKMGLDVMPYKEADKDDGYKDDKLIISYLHFASIGMIGASFVFKNASKKKLEQAFETYNK